MRWPLRIQIFVPFGCLLLTMLTLVSGLNAYLAAQHISGRIATQIETIGHSLETSNYPLTDSILQQTRALSGAEFIVTDEAGQVLAGTLETPREFRAPPAELGQQELPRTTDVAGQRYFHSVVRSERGQRRTLQLVHILYPERAWRESRWRAAYPPLLVGAVALAIVFGLSMTISSRLSRPLRQLQAQVGKFAGGEFEPLPLPQRDDELRDLIAAVNALVGELIAFSQAVQRSERLALMGQLSGGLAHHLRNAVTGAKLALQIHQRSCREADQESLAVAERQLRLTEEQLQRFLTAGRPQTPDRTACELRKLLTELSLLVAPMGQHRRVRLECVPPEASLPDIWADPAQLHQALLNLVLNALEAAGVDGWVRIECHHRSGESQVVIRVLDSGPGPPADLRPRLCEPFATGRPDGIGLGLAAAKQIAAAHGGRLVFASDAPTCFELWLPVAGCQPTCP